MGTRLFRLFPEDPHNGQYIGAIKLRITERIGYRGLYPGLRPWSQIWHTKTRELVVLVFQKQRHKRDREMFLGFNFKLMLSISLDYLCSSPAVPARFVLLASRVL